MFYYSLILFSVFCFLSFSFPWPVFIYLFVSSAFRFLLLLLLSQNWCRLLCAFIAFFSFVVSAIISFIHPLKQMTSSRLVYIDVDNNNNNRSHRSPVPNVACKAHQTKRDKWLTIERVSFSFPWSFFSSCVCLFTVRDAPICCFPLVVFAQQIDHSNNWIFIWSKSSFFLLVLGFVVLWGFFSSSSMCPWQSQSWFAFFAKG